MSGPEVNGAAWSTDVGRFFEVEKLCEVSRWRNYSDVTVAKHSWKVRVLNSNVGFKGDTRHKNP